MKFFAVMRKFSDLLHSERLCRFGVLPILDNRTLFATFMETESVLLGLRAIDEAKEFRRILHYPTVTEYKNSVKIVIPKSPSHYGKWTSSEIEYLKGLEEETVCDLFDITERDIVETEFCRSKRSIYRAASTVKDLIRCNDFDFFVTLTCDSEKVNRYNLTECVRVFQTHVRNKNRWRGVPIQYILVPELHPTSGAYHFHGVIRGLTAKDIRINENGYAEWDLPRDYLGFMSMSPIRDRDRCATYIAKYVTKSLCDAEQTEIAKRRGVHLYWASHGLNRPLKAKIFAPSEEIEKVAAEAASFSYETDFCKVVYLEKNCLGYSAFVREFADRTIY